jgi:Zn-dependent M28 family amino/carboxypeptidase
MHRLLIPALAAWTAACSAQTTQTSPALPPAAAAVAVAPAASEGSYAAAVETITEADIAARLMYLASDELKGRDTPSPGLEAAAAYIASEFMRYGLEPAGEQGGWMQRWPFVLRTADPRAATFAVQRGASRRELQVGRDFYSAAGAPATVNAGLVFTGATVDGEAAGLRDRIAVIHVPGGQAAAQPRINQARAAARAAGAVGLVAILDPGVDAEAVGRAVAGPATSRAGGAPPVPLFHLRYEPAREIFREAGLDLDGLARRAAAGPIAAVPLTGATASGATPFTDVDHRPPNVAGMVRGSDPVLRDSYIVLSAHFDHVGTGRPDASGDSIFNGADDNASGTTSILELAQAFAALDAKPARSIIFLAVSGEEKGLLGSAYYANNPTVPLESIIANINMDMIGRNSPDSIVVIGKDYSSLGDMANEIAARHPEVGLTLADDIWPEQRFFFRSDQFHFAAKEIPVLFFFAGVHEDYHRQGDHWYKIDTGKVMRVTRMVFHLTHAIANDPSPPQWTEDGLREVRELTSRRR